MTPDYKSIIEIFNNAHEIEKIVFTEALSDLLKWIIVPQKAKLIPQSLFLEDMTKSAMNELKFKSIKEYNDFIYEIKKIIYEGIDTTDKNSWLFVITKMRSRLWKETKDFYDTIWDEELDEVHYLRKLLLKNLEKYGVIEIFLSKNKEFQEVCDDFINTISEIDEKNKRRLRALENISDPFIRNRMTNISYDYWVDRIKRAFDFILNDLEIENFLCKKEELEKLYTQITGNKISNWVQAEFNKVIGIIRYDNKEMKVKVNWVPYKIIEYIFKSKSNDWIDLIDIYKYIEWVDDTTKFYKNEKKLRSSISNINRQFEKKIWKKKFLVYKDGALYKQY